MTVEELNALKAQRVEARQAMHNLAIGDKEVENNSVAVRTRDGKDLGVMNLEAFIEHLTADIARRGRVLSS